MTDERLADELVARTLGWRSAPDRYIKPGRSWIPRSKFRPLEDVRDALRLLDAVTGDYVLIGVPGGSFKVEAHGLDRTGSGAAKSKARAICAALAELFGLEMDGVRGLDARGSQ